VRQVGEFGQFGRVYVLGLHDRIVFESALGYFQGN
jgi:hypothetical protein